MIVDDSPEDCSLSDQLLRLARICQSREVDCDLLVSLLGSRGPAVLVLIFSLPFLLPISLPGISVLFGSLICLLGIYIATGSSIRLPRAVAKRPIPGAVISKTLLVATRIIQRVEPLLKPRFISLFSSKIASCVIGLVVVTGGLVVLLPLPPGANFVSSLVCVVVALGLATRDGILTLSGIVLFFGKLALYGYLIVLGTDWLKSYF